jgi:hypothetical protein
MITVTRTQQRHATQITALATTFGHLPINDAGQTTNDLLNLSIPLAYLVHIGAVTGVSEKGASWLHRHEVNAVREYCQRGIDYANEHHGDGWWNTATPYAFSPQGY